MLPSRGTCHAVLIMVKAASLRRQATRVEWISASKKQLTFLAAAANLKTIAEVMIRFGLVTTHEGIQLSHLTANLGHQADDATLKRVAKLLLEASPPAWLENALTQTGLATEYIPTQDLASLQWLGTELEVILSEIDARTSRQKDEVFTERLGNAGELVIMLSKKLLGEQPVRVSAISDSFGYDIETRGARGVERIEVKASVPKSKGNFFISRNEYEQSLCYGSEWYVLQVVFSPSILFKGKIHHDDILEANVLTASGLHQIIPSDPVGFQWLETAHIRPPSDSWTKHELNLPDDLEINIA